jgi:hypothetical protein
VTRPDVIRRELLLDICTSFDSARAAETERNLRSLGTFRQVEVDTVHSDTGVVLTVETRDGWSTRPELTFSSTGSQTNFTIGLSEENFLGRAAVFGVRYSSDPDRRRTSFRFDQRRFIGDFGLELGAEDRTDGWNASAAFGRPFFSYDSRTAASAAVRGFDGDVRLYREGSEEPVEILRRRYGYAELEAAHAWVATPEGYWRGGAGLQLTSDAYAPRGIVAERRTAGTVSLWVETSRARFVEVEEFRAIGRPEDVDLSPDLRIGLLAAPRAFGYEHSGVGLELAGRLGVPLGHGFAMVNAAANGLYAGGGLDSGRVSVSGTMLVRPAHQVAVLLHARSAWQENPAPGEEYELGFGYGLRAHRAHAFSGDRMNLLVGELRWTPVRDLFGLLHVGAAVVGAHGGAWWATDRRRYGSEVGGGLRIAPNRLADGTIGRIDLMWRFATERQPGGWVFVLGEGLTF